MLSYKLSDMGMELVADVCPGETTCGCPDGRHGDHGHLIVHTLDTQLSQLTSMKGVSVVVGPDWGISG